MKTPVTSVAPAAVGRPKDPAKRKAILDAAKSLFLSKGYDGSSMEAIAAEAGVSKLTVYSHFSDKETLFAAAVKSKCAEQLPQPFFEPASDTSIETVLLTIGRGFHDLVNSREAIELLRVMAGQANFDNKLSQLFLDAGPLSLMREMQRLLTQANQQQQLQIADPAKAAEHFFSLIKGNDNFRLLIGCCAERQNPEAIDTHIQDVVAVFLRAYRP